MRKLIFMVVGALLLTFAVAPAAAADGKAHVRVAHFSADTPTVDIFVNGAPSAIKALQYKSVSDWVDFDPGSYTFSTFTKGALRSGVFDLKADTWVTVAAVGSLKNNTLKLIGIDEDHSAIAKGRARIIIFQGIEDSSAVDVRSGNSLIASKLAFPGTQGPTGHKNDGVVTLTEKAGTYDLKIVPAGKKTPVLAELAATELKENTNYLVAAIGTKDKPEIDLVATTQS